MNTARRLLDDCFLHDKDRLRHDEALELLAARLSPVARVEEIELGHALGRVLAKPVVAPRPIPAFTNAAVDGYALSASDLAMQSETRLEIAMRIAAGHPAIVSLSEGQAARIFTGAPLPDGADTVVMQEDCETDDGFVSLPEGVASGMNVRRAGEDVNTGEIVAEEGIRLTPQLLAAIASTGTAVVSCYVPLKVALISSGDEVLRPGDPFARGSVYDSNHYLLSGLLPGAVAQITDFGILPDDKTIVRQALIDAARTQDVIITTGGASRGEEDHMVSLVSELGKLHGWQLAIKPGRPLTFGQIDNCVFLGLPGNPVAAFVCFLLYAQPMFAHLQGANWAPPQRFYLPAGFAITKKKPDRREFWRGWIEDGKLQKFARDGSGLVSGLTAATGLIEVPEDVTSVAEGDLLGFMPFSAFNIHT
jgi:molybdopterin molybdotransferase